MRLDGANFSFHFNETMAVTTLKSVISHSSERRMGRVALQ
jgi:hypothetical protein